MSIEVWCGVGGRSVGHSGVEWVGGWVGGWHWVGGWVGGVGG